MKRGLPALLFLVSWALICGCSGRAVPPGGDGRAAPYFVRAERVLVVYNQADTSSARVARYYLRRRAVPEANLVACDVPAEDDISLDLYKRGIESPVRDALASLAQGDSVEYIVLARGMPLRILEGGWSVDAFLGAMDLHLDPVTGRDRTSLARLANPYFGLKEHFHRRRFGLFLVTRLDGYTAQDAMALVDHAIHALPSPGPFLLDADINRDKDGYRRVNDSMRRAAGALRRRGLQVTLAEGTVFKGSASPLAGYYSWGSNDTAYDPEVYKSLRFVPGAIAETAVSTSARTFRPASGGQSLIADLIAGGVTGVNGYVSEPLADYLCPADLLFDRYTAGYNLAESFAMATPLLMWKGVVVGDPLCAPYARP